MPDNRMWSGHLQGPLVIVGVGLSELLLVKQQDAKDPNADAQMYELDLGAFFDEIKPLPIWLKFLYGMDMVEPAIPFTTQEQEFRLEKYRAEKRARKAATDGEV